MTGCQADDDDRKQPMSEVTRKEFWCIIIIAPLPIVADRRETPQPQ
jgi:hypothetical protein